MANFLIFGASRGLGAAFAEALPTASDEVWCVSRSRPSLLDAADGIKRHWIAHDLAEVEKFQTVLSAIGDRPIDLLLYNAGIWETEDFEKVSDAEIRSIVDVNLTSLLLAARHLSGNLRRSQNAKVVLISSTCGLDNEGTSSVAYAATKFAVRGAGQALREMLRNDKIAVTVLSPGSIASDVAYADGVAAALARHSGTRLPVGDLVEVVKLLLRLSPASCIKELSIPALADTDV